MSSVLHASPPPPPRADGEVGRDCPSVPHALCCILLTAFDSLFPLRWPAIHVNAFSFHNDIEEYGKMEAKKREDGGGEEAHRVILPENTPGSLASYRTQ